MNLMNMLQALNGKELRTLGEAKPFDIIDVEPKKIIVRPHSTMNERSVLRQELEGAYNELVAVGSITRVKIESHHSPRNPAYVAAILATLPDVRHRSKPKIELWVENTDAK